MFDNPAGWGHAEKSGIGSGERGVAAKAGPITGLSGRKSLLDQRLCQKQPLFCEIGVDGRACFLSKGPHEMKFADIKCIGQRIDGKLLLQMGVQVGHHGANEGRLRALRRSPCGSMLLLITVKLHQKLQEKSGSCDIAAGSTVCQFMLNGRTQCTNSLQLDLRKPKDRTWCIADT